MGKVGRPKNTGGIAPALTDSQIKTLLRVTASSANPERNLALVQLLLTGMRVSEPTFLTRAMVLDPARAKVLDSFVLGREHTKSGNARRCYLNASAHRALQLWVAAMENKHPEAKVFDLTPNYLTTLVKQLLTDAGIKSSSHSLRRTAATRLADRGVSPVIIQQLLGHQHLSTTQKYISINPNAVANAVQVNLTW